MNIVEKFHYDSRQPAFQELTDPEKEQYRENLFWQDLAPRLNSDQLDSVKQEYDQLTAPTGDPYAGVGEDGLLAA